MTIHSSRIVSSCEYHALWHGEKLHISTGYWAFQTPGAVTLRIGECVVLITAVVSPKVFEGGYVPFSIHYQARPFAAGKIPGGFLKREGSPSDQEILASRLIDRALRPLLPADFFHEIQVLCQVLSFDPKIDPSLLCFPGVSLALKLAGVPLKSFIAGTRIIQTRQDKTQEFNWAYSSSFSCRSHLDLDLIVAGTADSILMIESGAREITPEDMIEALKKVRDVIPELIVPFSDFFNKALESRILTSYSWHEWRKLLTPSPQFDETPDLVLPEVQPKKNGIKGRKKETIISNETPLNPISKWWKEVALVDLHALWEDIETEEFMNVQKRTQVILELQKKAQELGFPSLMIKAACEHWMSYRVRQESMLNNRRLDDRYDIEVRPLNCEADVLPRVHGSALFTRGGTQVLSIITLGHKEDEQRWDSLERSDIRENFIFHYNFPAFSVNEINKMGAPARREIGHGRLAQKALAPLMPASDVFPYTVRAVATVLSSDASSSQAAICSTSLALMSAGVPMPCAVGGIAMGLMFQNEILENDILCFLDPQPCGKRWKVVSDLNALEDADGAMDFKMAGTRTGLTALQMDVKVCSLPFTILVEALMQGWQGLQKVLSAMTMTLSSSRSQVSLHAPHHHIFHIPLDQVRVLIGTGGKNIKAITEKSSAKVDVDNGRVTVFAAHKKGLTHALELIQETLASISQESEPRSGSSSYEKRPYESHRRSFDQKSTREPRDSLEHTHKSHTKYDSYPEKPIQRDEHHVHKQFISQENNDRSEDKLSTELKNVQKSEIRDQRSPEGDDLKKKDFKNELEENNSQLIKNSINLKYSISNEKVLLQENSFSKASLNALHNIKNHEEATLSPKEDDEKNLFHHQKHENKLKKEILQHKQTDIDDIKSHSLEEHELNAIKKISDINPFTESHAQEKIPLKDLQMQVDHTEKKNIKETHDISLKNLSLDKNQEDSKEQRHHPHENDKKIIYDVTQDASFKTLSGSEPLEQKNPFIKSDVTSTASSSKESFLQKLQEKNLKHVLSKADEMSLIKESMLRHQSEARLKKTDLGAKLILENEKILKPQNEISEPKNITAKTHDFLSKESVLLKGNKKQDVSLEKKQEHVHLNRYDNQKLSSEQDQKKQQQKFSEGLKNPEKESSSQKNTDTGPKEGRKIPYNSAEILGKISKENILINSEEKNTQKHSIKSSSEQTLTTSGFVKSGGKHASVKAFGERVKNHLDTHGKVHESFEKPFYQRNHLESNHSLRTEDVRPKHSESSPIHFQRTREGSSVLKLEEEKQFIDDRNPENFNKTLQNMNVQIGMHHHQTSDLKLHKNSSDHQSSLKKSESLGKKIEHQIHDRQINQNYDEKKNILPVLKKTVLASQEPFETGQIYEGHIVKMTSRHIMFHTDSLGTLSLELSRVVSDFPQGLSLFLKPKDKIRIIALEGIGDNILPLKIEPLFNASHIRSEKNAYEGH